MGKGTLPPLPMGYKPHQPDQQTPALPNGYSISEPVKKKEDSQPSVNLSEGAAKISQNGTQPTAPSLSASQLSSGADAVTSNEVESAPTGVVSSILQQPKVSPIQKVVDLAKKQQDEKIQSLHTMMPLLPQAEHTDLISQGMADNTAKRVEDGDPNAISDVVGKELAQINLAKQRRKEDLNRHYGAGANETIDPDAQIKQYRQDAANVLNDGIDALNTVYGNKLLASPDKSANVQNQMGEELRSHYAKIGADYSLSDQQGIAAKIPDLEEKINLPQYKHLIPSGS